MKRETIEEFRTRMEKQGTNVLQRIWDNHRIDEWTDEELQIVQEILSEREKSEKLSERLQSTNVPLSTTTLNTQLSQSEKLLSEREKSEKLSERLQSTNVPLSTTTLNTQLSQSEKLLLEQIQLTSNILETQKTQLSQLKQLSSSLLKGMKKNQEWQDTQKKKLSKIEINVALLILALIIFYFRFETVISLMRAMHLY